MADENVDFGGSRRQVGSSAGAANLVEGIDIVGVLTRPLNWSTDPIGAHLRYDVHAISEILTPKTLGPPSTGGWSHSW